MPRKTLYVAEAELQIYAEAEAFAEADGGSLSGVVASLLKLWVASKSHNKAFYEAIAFKKTARRCAQLHNRQTQTPTRTHSHTKKVGR